MLIALLHPQRVLCAYASHKVNFHKNPATTKFCRRNITTLRHALKRDGVHVQELCGLLKGKRGRHSVT